VNTASPPSEKGQVLTNRRSIAVVAFCYLETIPLQGP
jgi:hypothetical protein